MKVSVNNKIISKSIKTVYKKKKSIKYGDKECPRAVFNKARKLLKNTILPGEEDIYEWRRCAITGRKIRFSHYGLSTEYGWHMDHDTPQAKGGSDELFNLKAVYWRQNISQGASLYNKPKGLEKFHDIIRKSKGISRSYKNSFKWTEDIKGKYAWIKELPSSQAKLAIISDFNKTRVSIYWADAKFSSEIPLDKDLIELI